MNNFKFFPGYSEGYKNNGSKKYKKGDLYKINNEDVAMSRKLITEITSKLTNQNNKFSKFYYITHIDNLNSILKKGIKPRNHVINRNYSPVDISNANVQRYRDFNIKHPSQVLSEKMVELRTLKDGTQSARISYDLFKKGKTVPLNPEVKEELKDGPGIFEPEGDLDK